ncbi:MAG: hypothetical protein ABIQ89_02555 [Candidatus Saccharimonadales bacterium]
MQTASAEIGYQQTGEILPRAILVPEMAVDRLIRQRADRFIRAAGSVSLAEHVQIEEVSVESPTTDQATNLMDSVHRAKHGDTVARQMVRANSEIDLVERTIKAGNIIEVLVAEDEDGELVQHGQSLDSVHSNSLRFASATPAMRERAEPEARNNFRIKHHYKADQIDDHYFVVLSRFPDKSAMTDEEARKAGFFLDTKSAAFQATIKQGAGVKTESAFVAGAKHVDAPLHDERAIIAMGAYFGIDYSGKTAAEIIDMPMLIPKSLMPNGVVDLVKLYDQFAGGTFFGQAKPAEDYLAFKQFCRQRQVALSSTVEEVVEELIDRAHEIHTPLQAVEMLDEISEKKMVIYSVKKDHTIDPRVFGPVAARHIERARLYELAGEVDKANESTILAQETAESYSCPSAREKDALAANDAEKLGDSESLNSLIRCIKCRKYVKKKEVVKKQSWCCPKCKYEVDICNGKEIPKEEVVEKEPAKLISFQEILNKPKEDSTIEPEPLAA